MQPCGLGISPRARQRRSPSFFPCFAELLIYSARGRVPRESKSKPFRACYILRRSPLLGVASYMHCATLKPNL